MAGDGFALGDITLRPVEVVIGDAAGEAMGGLGQRQQSALQGGDGHAGGGVGVDGGVHIGPGSIDRAVDDEGGRLEVVVRHALAELRLQRHAPVEIGLQQRGSGDLAEQQSMRDHQELAGAVRHPRRNMGGDHVGHAEMVAKPVARGEVQPGLPLGRTDAALLGRDHKRVAEALAVVHGFLR